MKLKMIIILLIAAGALYLGSRYVHFGSLTRNCIYTENNLPVPEQLAKGEVVVEKDTYVAIGVDKETSCLKNLGSFDREIVGLEAINNPSIGRHYFTRRGLSVESLKKGLSFYVIDVVEITKHGFWTIDSGSGPSYYLILKDQNNILYKISTMALGSHEEDVFLSFVGSSLPVNPSAIKFLSIASFDQTMDHEGKISLKYTGELTESPGTSLQSTEPQ